MIGRLLTTSIATGTWGTVKSHRLCAVARRRLGRGASVALLLTPVLTCYEISISLPRDHEEDSDINLPPY